MIQINIIIIHKYVLSRSQQVKITSNTREQGIQRPMTNETCISHPKPLLAMHACCLEPWTNFSSISSCCSLAVAQDLQITSSYEELPSSPNFEVSQAHTSSISSGIV